MYDPAMSLCGFLARFVVASKLVKEKVETTNAATWGRCAMVVGRSALRPLRTNFYCHHNYVP